MNAHSSDSPPHLTRSFGLLHATALNMANMVGIGPFITIPLLMATMGGPQALLGWWVGALIVICDGQVWSELGAALPGSGGSYRFLREAYGPESWGRLMAFLFIWQFVLSGPLEVASGMIGFAQYAAYLWPGLTARGQQVIAAGVGALAVVLLARRITFLSRVTVTLWVGTILTLVAVLASGLPRFEAARAFAFPPGAFTFDRGFVLGLGSAALIAIYDYLGYYDICYIGDEVRDPARVIPRSILLSIVGCAVAYFLLHLALLGVVPWREILGSQFIVSEFMERLHGRLAAVAVTVMILWTAFGSIFALLLGYSRIPYAAAVRGDFFRPFARLHPTGNFPHVSLYVLGAVSIVAAFFTLDQVIKALITTRVLVQFMGQIFAVPLLRKRLPASARPYRMWLYPVPAVIAFAGWTYIFVTSGWIYVAVGVATLAVGVGAFLVRAAVGSSWPFGPRAMAAAAAFLLLPAGVRAAERVPLASGWAIQSSARVTAAGDALSQPGYETDGWHRAAVPSTVIAALVADGTFPDPYFAMNFRSLPGASYPIGKNFSQLPMPEDSPFRVAWWYRTEFDLPPASGRRTWLHFDGINYRANVWLNGRRIADGKEVAGAFRRYEFDVTSLARAGARNALAVEVFAPEPGELAFNWVDWNPMPPDKNMGLWGEVYLTDSGALALRHPQVLTKLDLPSLDAAHLTVTAEVWNATDAAVSGLVKGAIGAIRFSRPVRLGPAERTTIRFRPEEVAELNLAHPRVWWPYRLGSPELYTLVLEAEASGAPSDRQEVRFGIQEMSSELTEKGHRLFKVNGRKVLIRGGGWASDMLLRPDPERLEAELRYVRDMGLNAIRSEGKLESDLFYDLADRYGILIMTGWCCCDHWEKWADWDDEDRRVATASLDDQMVRLRNHPSVFAWLNGSDNPPPPSVEEAYLEVERRREWPKAVLSSATAKPAASGASGVKMNGPYDYVPPSYWLRDTRAGGAHGFATEMGPGGAVPPIESLKRMLPAEHLWPIDEVWNFHAGGGQFKDLKLFTEALEARYGKASGAEDYARKAQALAYEGQRAMFEAFGRNKYTATGVIQWMLNNAWPSTIWHLYDYYLRPGGGYFGTKKACEPLHAQYSDDDRSVVVVNDTAAPAKGLKVRARVLDLDLKPLFTREAAVDVDADGVTRAFVIPDLAGLGSTYFVRLDLEDAAGQSVGSNFYWLSAREDVLDWDKTDWYHTPVRTHADLTALARLPKTTLRLSRLDAGRVRVENTGSALAFQVRLKLVHDGEEVLPVLWQDNYFELLPGEAREIRVQYSASPAPVSVEAAAWNADRVLQGAVPSRAR
jgi:exo-1,4-beta-D-glucosaminidase